MVRVAHLFIIFLVIVSLYGCDILAGATAAGIEEAVSAPHGIKGGLKINSKSHYLQYRDGMPFFWFGDTGWELFHRLNKEEIEKYLENRRQKGFNVIQAVILAEFDGLRKPNQYGEVPLINMDPTKPNEKYFELVDWTVKRGLEKEMFMGLLPTWGDKVAKMWGEGPEIFNESNAYEYGLFLGKRYAKFPNIIWILGGDRQPVKDTSDWRPVWRAMAKGIMEGADNNKTIITYHTSGGEHTTSYDLHKEKWLDINSMQSGHGSGHDVPVWKWIEWDRSLLPTKPTLDMEPNYEDHPVNPWPKWDSANGYFRDYDVRKQIYRSVFAGACGVTYGHHAIWQFWSPREEKINHADRYWTEALDRPGAYQVGYLRKLCDATGLGMPDQSLIVDGQGEKGEYATAVKGGDKSCLVYLPVGKKISVNLSFLKSNQVYVWWFNPRTGKALKSGVLDKEPIMSFTSPTTGFENDWVLIIGGYDIRSLSKLVK